MSSNHFNLIDVVAALQKKWKQIIVFVFIVLAITAITIFLLPKQFKSTAVVIPANPSLADKSRLFNTNIQSLYSFFGNGDDVEVLYGLANLDTVYYQLIDQFKLVDYYESKGENELIKKKHALKSLKEDMPIQKNEFNQLKINVWNKDREQAAQIANTTVDIIQQLEQATWKKIYQNELEKTNQSITTLEKEFKILSDSIQASYGNDHAPHYLDLLAVKRENIVEQIKQYTKSVNELQLSIATTPPTLYVVEKAQPASIAERPAKLEILIAAFFTSLIFGIIAALVYGRKQTL
jgi:capsular polysaccharide biosynthesis protein